MKKDDLTQVNHVGPARMKLLNDSGITTIKQLSEAPLEKLTQINRLSEHYAKLIKDAATEVYGKKPEETAPETGADKEKKIEEINQNLKKQIKIFKKRLKQANEDLKPMGKKKYLESYIDLKKRSKKLRTRLKSLDQKQGDLSNKDKKNIIKIADALSATLKNVGKKPKKKKYQKVSQEIQSFSKVLK